MTRNEKMLMTITIGGKEVRVERLDTATTGDCPIRGCGRSAYPYGVDGCNGYVDTCAEHARAAFLQALREGAIDTEEMVA